MGALTKPVMDMTLQPQSDGPMALIERLAMDPNCDPARLEKLIELYERGQAKVAREAFNAAMAAAQAEMRPVATDMENRHTKSRYASYAKLDNAIRPIYTRHGFSLSFNTEECPTPECVRLVCRVSHSGGHHESYRLDMPLPSKGAKGGDVMTPTQATGGATSYGMRYLSKMIWNISVGEDDQDGNMPDAQVTDPEGFQRWWDDMGAAADNGLDTFAAAWKASPQKFRDHTFKHYRREHEARKAKAAEVGAAS